MNWLKLSLSLCASLSLAQAADWPQWRGPNFNGSTDETGLPATWSKTDHVVWSLDLPGPSAATPIIWGDRVFVSTTDLQNKSLHALCVDRKSGQVLWKNEVAIGFQKDDRSNFASPSPVTDGKIVIFFYGTGDFAAFDFAGKKIWSRNLQKDYGDFAFQWTFSASPLLHQGKLYQPVLQRDVPVNGRGRKDGPIESFLLAMNPQTGATIWKVDRPSDAAAESKESYATPVPFEFNGRKEILIAGGDCLSGHDPESGRELWRSMSWNPTKITHWRLVPSAVAGGGVILGSAPKGSPIYAVKAGATGQIEESGLAWKSSDNRDVSADVPTPLFYQGDFFVLNEGKRLLSRVEPLSGKVKWTTELPGRIKYEASPTGADGRIFTINFKGEVAVVDAAKGTVLQTIPMGDEGDDLVRSALSVAHRQLFIRTNKRLYCIGDK